MASISRRKINKIKRDNPVEPKKPKTPAEMGYKPIGQTNNPDNVDIGDEARRALASIPDSKAREKFRKQMQDRANSVSAKKTADATKASGKSFEAYGQTLAQTGQDVQGVKKRMEQGVTGEDPMSDYIRRSSSQRLAAAKGSRAGGMSTAESAQLDRGTTQQLQQGYTQNLTAYQEMLGNMLSGQSSLELGWANAYETGVA